LPGLMSIVLSGTGWTTIVSGAEGTGGTAGLIVRGGQKNARRA